MQSFTAEALRARRKIAEKFKSDTEAQRHGDKHTQIS
jgi:hypothetical protein